MRRTVSSTSATVDAPGARPRISTEALRLPLGWISIVRARPRFIGTVTRKARSSSSDSNGGSDAKPWELIVLRRSTGSPWGPRSATSKADIGLVAEVRSQLEDPEGETEVVREPVAGSAVHQLVHERVDRGVLGRDAGARPEGEPGGVLPCIPPLLLVLAGPTEGPLRHLGLGAV